MNATLQVMGTNTEMNIVENSIGIWFTQAHSCQRDLILAAKHTPFNLPIHVVASHPEWRPEITSVADIALQSLPLLSAWSGCYNRHSA